MSTRLSTLRGYFTGPSPFQRQKNLEQLISDINIIENELNGIELKLKDISVSIEACNQYIKSNTPLMSVRKRIIETLIANAKTDSARQIEQEKLKRWEQDFVPITKTELNLQAYKDIQNELLSQKRLLTESLDNKKIRLQAFLSGISPDNIDVLLFEKAKTLIKEIAKDVTASTIVPPSI